jgi:hypothetical protein
MTSTVPPPAAVLEATATLSAAVQDPTARLREIPPEWEAALARRTALFIEASRARPAGDPARDIFEEALVDTVNAIEEAQRACDLPVTPYPRIPNAIPVGGLSADEAAVWIKLVAGGAEFFDVRISEPSVADQAFRCESPSCGLTYTPPRRYLGPGSKLLCAKCAAKEQGT